MAGKVVLDLNNPVFLEDFLSLDRAELARVARTLKRLGSMNWDAFTRHRGSNWELIGHVQAPNGKPAHSFRLSRKYRALAYRDGELLRILSLHLDHDSAYED